MMTRWDLPAAAEVATAGARSVIEQQKVQPAVLHPHTSCTVLEDQGKAIGGSHWEQVNRL
jgi:hypothetical protein